MVFASVMHKTMTLSPKLLALSRPGSFLLAPSRSFCMSVSEVTPRQLAEDKFTSKDDDHKKDHHHKLTSNDMGKPIVNSDDLNGIKRVSDKMLLDNLKLKMSSNTLSSVNLGGIPFEIKETAEGRTLILTRNDDPREVVTIEVDVSSIESQEADAEKPIPFTLTVTRDCDGGKCNNQFKLSLSDNQIVVNGMSIKKSPTLENSPDAGSDDESDDEPNDKPEDRSNDSSDDSSDDDSDDKPEDRSNDSSDDSSDDDSDDKPVDRSDDSSDDSSDDDSDDKPVDISNDSSDDSSDDDSDDKPEDRSNIDRSDEAETKCVDKNNEELEEYVGPDYKELDDCWQRGIRYYLEARGIKPDMISSLREYIANKKKVDESSVWKSKFMDLFLW